jgi:hypothetical protein
MPGDPPQEPTKVKIFPRNLTARADYIVRGNPTNTRPESGVDNCYPGLEFDQRNLDKAFFPGLVFEFHRNDGAILHRIVPGGLPAQKGLADTDLPLYLWAVMGRTTVDQSDQDPPAFFFFGLNGLDVWRRVHDLLPGHIAILIGPAPGFSALPASTAVIRELDRLRDSGESAIQRNELGKVEIAIFVGERERYLDENGVIDADVYEPGELTRSLCAPWQYDFRDCGCFYWASNKPDLVTSADGQHRYLNFQRKDRTSFPPPSDIPTYGERRAQELDYAELIGGAWNDLPVVLNDRESEQFVPPPAPTVTRLMSRQEVIDELRYLVTVEHALCVEYLYAHYSIKAPSRLPNVGADDQTRHLFAAANEIFMIAVDEMRHLRWVNEALDLLGQTPSLGRAKLIGRTFRRRFSLRPLTPKQLQWFIDVEKPSQEIGGRIDGMYVVLHTSIDRQSELFPERDRLVHLIKLIIDEGGDHYERFISVQKHLAGMQPDDYLRTLEDAPPGFNLEKLQDLSDQNYAVLLGTLQVSFSLGDRAGGILLEQARRAMFNLHETNHHLASNGVRSRFTLPPAPALPFTAETAHAHVDTLASSVREVLSAVTDTGGETEQVLAERQRRINEELFEKIHQLIREDLGG